MPVARASSQEIRRAPVEKRTCMGEESASNLLSKKPVFRVPVSPEVFADTQEPRVRQRGLGLLGCLCSFNTSTIVTTNVCNSNIFRDQNFRDVPWGDPNSQRLVAHKELDSWGGTIFLGDQGPTDSPVREVFGPGGGPAVWGQCTDCSGGRDGL